MSERDRKPSSHTSQARSRIRVALVRGKYLCHYATPTPRLSPGLIIEFIKTSVVQICEKFVFVLKLCLCLSLCLFVFVFVFMLVFVFASVCVCVCVAIVYNSKKISTFFAGCSTKRTAKLVSSTTYNKSFLHT